MFSLCLLLYKITNTLT